MPACEECYRAKVRCDNQHPCGRCTLRDLMCVARISRQGKKRKRSTVSRSEATDVCIAVANPTNNKNTVAHDSKEKEEQEQHPSEDQDVMQDIGSLGKNHFGVRYLLHSWISFAFTRRSFGLLGRASRLAVKCNIPMDEIFNRQRQSVLGPTVLFDSASEQQQQEHCCNQALLSWSDLPPTLLEVCSCGPLHTVDREDRLILVREAREGHSRFLVSRAFADSVVTRQVLQQTWDNNTGPIVMTFLDGPNDFAKFTKAISVQIANYKDAGKRPIRTRVPDMYLKMNNGTTTQQVELLHCYELVSLEHSFYLSEYIVPGHADNDAGRVEALDSTGQKHEPKTKNSSMPVSHLDESGPLLNDLLLDPDLERILNLIG